MGELNVSYRNVNEDIRVIKLNGLLNNNSCIDLKEVIKTANKEGYYNIILDCNGLENMDGEGLDALYHCMDACQMSAGDIKLINVNKKVSAIIEYVGLAMLVDMCDSEQDAISLF